MCATTPSQLLLGSRRVVRPSFYNGKGSASSGLWSLVFLSCKVVSPLAFVETALPGSQSSQLTQIEFSNNQGKTGGKKEKEGNVESGWASCILLTIDISKSWAVPMISSNGPFFGDACQYTVSLFPQALERERKRQEETCHFLLIL